MEKKAYLSVSGLFFELSSDKITIGRKLSNDIVLNKPLISRNHAEVTYDGENYTITDLGSTGGVFLNSKKIESAILISGDTIFLADIPVLFMNESEGISNTSEEDTGKLRD